ncbi:hypothetical protein [Enterobacter hormaechei]|uniref:hypothetical protein n=1 Tax=Enterobacter hormaechei TaxID=158836 RepID=UPI000AD30B2E|nr:hypothetical protein [Enterobacter hormaechei]
MLFKFLEKQYLSAFFSCGSIRIGTIYDFKDTVAHTSARSDISEGKHQIFRGFTSRDEFTNIDNEPIINDIFKISGEGAVSFENVSFNATRDSGDGFIFCTSRYYSKKTFLKWHEDCFKNDACYAIINPGAFFDAITDKIRNSVYECLNANIVYTTDPIPYDSPEANLNPALTKEINKYSWQCENRSIWSPRLPPLRLRPFNIEVPEAIQFCEPLSYIQDGKIVKY